MNIFPGMVMKWFALPIQKAFKKAEYQEVLKYVQKIINDRFQIDFGE